MAVVIAYMYYRHRVAAIQESYQNPNQSTDSAIGSLMSGSTYQGQTGQYGDTRTANYRYSEYRQYLAQGGTNSGSTFDQFLTAAQTQALPSN